MFFEVAVRSPLRRLFTYESDRNLPRGVRVKVPFRSRHMVGFVWNAVDKAPEGLKTGVKKVTEVFDETPFFDDRTLSFYERSAAYYGISLGDLLGASLPEKVREGAVLPSFTPKHFVPYLPELSAAQKEVVQSISKDAGFKTHLLLGETGSGKTEIYLKLMENILLEGGQALFLVPEISLTPQLEDRLTKRLGCAPNIFHSQMTESKRLETFVRAMSGEAGVFLGARSALFLPFKNLQMIVVDEEHDGSYKQSERGPYHARDLSILRGQIFNLPIVLGSATPSLESYSRAVQQNAPLHKLPPFFQNKAQKENSPEIKIIDLKDTWKTEGRTFITDTLHEAVTQALHDGEQCLLFLNRRGSASQRVCVDCGAQDECIQCSVTLTIHEDLNAGICHWCGYQRRLSSECSSCKGSEFFMGGIGTKEVETQVKARFPEARIARLDRDKTAKKNVLADTLRDFAAGKIDILIGTQMISKGIDIPKLSTVGVVFADQGWGVPDFRASEKSFQLMKQLMGRAGRRGQKSRILIQTFTPDSPIFKFLKSESAFETFAQEELEIRKAANLPPFTKLCLLTLQHKNEGQLERAANIFAKRANVWATALGLSVMGPVPAPLKRWKGYYRMHILVKGGPKDPLSTFISSALDDLDLRPLGVQIKLDRDPYQFL